MNKYKMSLLTALIATACISQAASASELTSGSITNQTTATADVKFNQPITLENTLTPVAGIKAGAAAGMEHPVTIATGTLAIKEAGATAQLALKVNNSDGTLLTVYADGHKGDDKYALVYTPSFGNTDVKWDAINVAGDGRYMISPTVQRQLTYKVLAQGIGSVLPGAGTYTISVTGAVYNP